jgi:hypothetical protein
MATDPIEKATGISFRVPAVAFNEAILSGRLSSAPGDAKYAGKFMYMGTSPDGKDLFKNIDTRAYLP